MSPVWVCLEILGDFYFMKGLISYTSFAFGICLSEVWALKEILSYSLLIVELIKFHTWQKIYLRSSYLAICA